MTSGSYIFFIRLLFGLFPLEILFQWSVKGNNPTCHKTFMKFLQERLGPISCNITLQYRDKMLKGPLQLNFGTRPFPDKMVTTYQPKKKKYLFYRHPYCQNMSFLGCAIYHARSLFCIEIISCTTFLTWLLVLLWLLLYPMTYIIINFVIWLTL